MFMSFGHLTKKCLLFLAVPLTMSLRLILTKLASENESKKEERNIFYHVFLKFLGRSLHWFLWSEFERMILSSKEKKNQDNKESILVNYSENNHDVLYSEEQKRSNSIYNLYKLDCSEKRKIEKKNTRKKIFLLILVSVLDFFYVTSIETVSETNLYYNRSIGVLSLTLVIRLFAIAILSKLIIENTKLYRHHNLSVMIILIVVIIINIYSVFFKNDNIDYFQTLGLMILPEVFCSIMYVYGAKYLTMTNVNIYKLLFFDGIIGMILSILLQIITHSTISCNKIQHFFYNIESICDNENRLNIICENFQFKLKEYVILISLIILNFVESWLIWLLIYNFSVNHFGVIWSISSLSFLFIGIDDFKTINYIASTLGCVTIIFAAFVYNEIIILKFCGFDENTVTEINRRSLRDLSCDFGKDEFSENSSYLSLQYSSEEISKQNSIKSELSNF